MKEAIISENFDSASFSDQFKWHAEPGNWMIKNKQLVIESNAKTDFWQNTHYGFQADNGHLLYTEVEGDFILETQVDCEFNNQYDQAGLMVRDSENCWVKTSVEYEPDESNKLGAVVTNHGYSDWSTQDADDNFTRFSLRIIRKNSDYIIRCFSEITDDWIQLRMFHLFDKPVMKAGIYCCSPKESGFISRFNYLKIEHLY